MAEREKLRAENVGFLDRLDPLRNPATRDQKARVAPEE